MKILTAAQIQRIDRLTTERYAIPSLTLMENAGRGVVRYLEDHYAPLASRKIAIFCGRGNNGGDGLVVARLLRQNGLHPHVVLFADPAGVKGDAQVNLERLTATGRIEVARDLEAWKRFRPRLADANLVVDALLGTGLGRALEGFLLAVVRDVNETFAGVPVVAVDLPSGLSADSGELLGECVRADASVTFTAPKFAHVFPPACEKVGRWVTHPIGTPAEALENDPELRLNLTTPEDISWLAAPRPSDSNKGNFGHVLLLAGSLGKTGAAAMAAKAAQRSGAGLVTIATPKSALPVVAALGMEFMSEALPETVSGAISLKALESGRLDELVKGKSVLAIGPGIGREPQTFELVRETVKKYDLPMVIDADGLNALAGHLDLLKLPGRVRVLTPHPGEMSRLADKPIPEIQANRLEAACEFAQAHQVYLVLKGFRSLTAAPDGQVWVNPTGNPGMATGGTGDVLTGIVAAFLGQSHRQFPALAPVIAAAVYLHGLAGDLAAAEKGEHSMIAGDLLDMISWGFRALGGAERKKRAAVRV